jgi:nicotinamidase-related amidase
MDNQKKTKTELDELLTNMRITDVYVCGLAVDYCVGESGISFDFFFGT